MRIPVSIEISPEALADLRAAVLGKGGGIQVAARVATPTQVELPAGWKLVEERKGESYTWPKPAGPDYYLTFRIYEGVTSAGTIRLAIGECERVAVRGRDRKYAITFYMTPAGSKRPISEFLETDDYENTRDLIAIIKGSDGGAKMYDPDGDLPAAYAPFRIETYRDRIDVPGSYKKLGVVAREDDVDSMLGHTLIQAQTRFDLGPA